MSHIAKTQLSILNELLEYIMNSQERIEKCETPNIYKLEDLFLPFWDIFRKDTLICCWITLKCK